MLVIYHIAKDLETPPFLKNGSEEADVPLSSVQVFDRQLTLPMNRYEPYGVVSPRKRMPTSSVLLTAMRCQGLVQHDVALLMQVAPDEVHGQVAFGPGGRQFRPDVFGELLLVQRKLQQPVDVALFKRRDTSRASASGVSCEFGNGAPAQEQRSRTAGRTSARISVSVTVCEPHGERAVKYALPPCSF